MFALCFIKLHRRIRKAKKIFLKQFTETSYASLKESLVTLEFAYERKFLNKKDFEKLNELGDRIGKMLWGILSKIN
ncbi:MAG: four helix bundle protein [Candidatus Paceibacterota bacterium]